MAARAIEQRLKNNHQRLIFKQDLQDGACVACQRVGHTLVAYDFNLQGVFLGSKLISVHAP